MDYQEIEIYLQRVASEGATGKAADLANLGMRMLAELKERDLRVERLKESLREACDIGRAAVAADKRERLDALRRIAFPSEG